LSFDFRKAMNTISDVVQNRPIPLREFDQIYMKVGDLIIQAEFIARRFDKLNVLFIGDGDAISLSVMHLKTKGIFNYGPSKIHVLDFDERVVNSINNFAKKNEMAPYISSSLYNVADPLPENLLACKDAFYTNPPWGASNEGESVIAFMERGMESLIKNGLAVIVIADDETLLWTQDILQKVQLAFINNGYMIVEMIPGLHNYHLDDAPDLKSCTLITKKIHEEYTLKESKPLETERLYNFYGRQSPLRIRYVRDNSGLNRGRAHDSSYSLEPL
jgi:N4-bis(aminopropyl)spermidine synthase